jgi:hypothetical protein
MLANYSDLTFGSHKFPKEYLIQGTSTPGETLWTPARELPPLAWAQLPHSSAGDNNNNNNNNNLGRHVQLTQPTKLRWSCSRIARP